MCSKSLQFVANVLLLALASAHPTMPESGASLSTNHNVLQRQQPQQQFSQHEIYGIEQQQQNASGSPTALAHKSYDIIDDVFAPQSDYNDIAAYNFALDAEHRPENSTKSRSKRALADWFIAPDTRWCGRGNTAGKYNNLGGASSADKCCRKHDHCQLFIAGMSNRYDLFNYRPYTLSHCSCDQRFRTCLKMASDDREAANTIGKLFFNMVQTQCFVLKTETICLQKDASGKHCLNERIKQKAYLRNNRKF